MKNKKHIIFILENNSYPDDVRVYKETKTAHEAGYDVSIISPKSKKNSKSFEIIDGMHVYRHPIPFEGGSKSGLLYEYVHALFWEFILSVKVFCRKKFHIIHSANPPDNIFLIALLFKPFGAKFIFDHHDVCPENYLAKFGREDFLYKLLFWFEHMTFKTADVVISTNESYKKLAQERGGKKAEQVFVVRNGPDLSQVHFMPPNDKWKGNADYLVVYIGAIGSQEGIDNLIRSVDYLVHDKKVLNVKFVVVGSGTAWQEMVDYAEYLDLTDYIHFTGFVPYEQFYEIIATADICVNPEFRNSFTDKSTMIKIMDYMVFGKPIVQYHTTEGMFTAGDASVYIENNDEKEFADVIVDLLHDPQLRERMGDVARQRIETKFLWDYQKENLKKAYAFVQREDGFKRPLRNRIFYEIKPLIPRKMQLFLRRLRVNAAQNTVRHVWPVNSSSIGRPEAWEGWPDKKQFALLITHDVDTAGGYSRIGSLMELEKQKNIRSTFFIVPERYQISEPVHRELKENGFEIALHGLYHDGKLFHSRDIFNRRAEKINRYIREWDVSGFRSPCMHHDLELMHKLDIIYDASTYDTDPFEPQGGGIGTIFPFLVKDVLSERTYIEIPYTLPQDHLLFVILKNKTIDIWKRKLDWIAQKGGLAHVIIHPDYICFDGNTAGIEEYSVDLYLEFLQYIQNEYSGKYWMACAKDVAAYYAAFVEKGNKMPCDN